MSSLQNGDILFCAPSQYVMYSSEQDLQVRNTRKPWLFYSIPKNAPCRPLPPQGMLTEPALLLCPWHTHLCPVSIHPLFLCGLPQWCMYVCPLFLGKLGYIVKAWGLNSSVFFTQHQVYHVYSGIYKSGCCFSGLYMSILVCPVSTVLHLGTALRTSWWLWAEMRTVSRRLASSR